MLTGDKLETGENIAHSCRLITGEMHVMRTFGKTADEVHQKLKSNKEEFNLCMNEKRKKAFIVEGEALGNPFLFGKKNFSPFSSSFYLSKS